MSAPEHLPSVVIGWGTFRGKSQRYAKAIALSIGHSAQALKQISPASLVSTNIFIACLSTCGNGAHTADSGAFIDALAGGNFDLGGLKVAVLGLGSSHYPHFCKAGNDLYAALVRHGATPLVPYTRSDLKTPDLGLGAVAEFHGKLFAALSAAGFKPKVPIEFAVGEASVDLVSPPPRGYAWVPVVRKEVLSGAGYTPRLWRITFGTKEYKCGDHALALPRNDPAQVSAILEKYGIDPKAKVTVKDEGCATLLAGDVTAFDLLSQWLDLSAPVPEALKRFGVADSVAALLMSVTVPLPSILADIPQMAPRTYSIASSRDELQLVVAEVLGADGVARPSSVFWAGLESGAVALKVVTGSLALEPGKNLIMVALGSGIAAMMSLVREWAALGAPTRAMLVYGARFEASAAVLTAELRDKSGPLAKLEFFQAISREGPKEHVNEVILREKDRVLGLWNESSNFYYCGSPAGYESTKATLVQILGDASRFEHVKAFVEAY